MKHLEKRMDFTITDKSTFCGKKPTVFNIYDSTCIDCLEKGIKAFPREDQIIKLINKLKNKKFDKQMDKLLL